LAKDTWFSRKTYQADLQIFMDWFDLAWVGVSRRKVTQFKTFGSDLEVLEFRLKKEKKAE